jgi:hypothetical protein
MDIWMILYCGSIEYIEGWTCPLLKFVSALVLNVVGVLRRFGGVAKGVRSK